MSQKDLAKAVGVSRQTIVAIEKGQYSPTLELCFKIALVFNKTIDEVFYVEKNQIED
ncbi:MAG: helix-turn-helix transcriptional regulator [Acholeplasmataceae bacterium]|nr:helix-turn-helix transcriptional regulator [Acholeplasmataceae bacterium]